MHHLTIGSNTYEVVDQAGRASIAPDYDSTSTYAVGDLVLHEGQLYECSSAISTAEAWTAAHWTSKTVAAEVTSLIGDYTDIDERVTALEQSGGSGLTSDIKQALLQLAAKVAYVDDDGQDYYDDLYDAFYPPADLVSISAVYTQSGTVYPTSSLDSLKSDLVVTALYDDQSTATITTYTLSGTLTVGTSTITVSYGGKTTTFTVTVTAAPTVSSISAVYTQSGTVYDTDSLDSLKTDLVVTATYSDTTTATVPSTDYTLSGTLTAGTSVVTVTYVDKTTTFNVTVTSGVLTGYTEIGNPTISNNILTVADGKFVKSNVDFTPGNSSWRITCKYRNTSGSYSSYTDILGSVDSSNASYRSILLESTVNTGAAISMYLSSNGTSWDIGSGNNTQASNIPHGQGVWVWLDFSFDGSSYILKYSTDGETYTTGKTHANTDKVVGGYPLAFGLKRNGYLQGEIDLSECKIYIDDSLYWSAV